MIHKARKRVLLRAIEAPEGDAPLPTEFRIFTAGVNESFNGPCVYDEAAEASVMAEYKRHGVRMMIDLEHSAWDGSNRTDSRDARGWFSLEARNGELWAVDIEWTEDGARRLRNRTQRYTSPAFLVDEDHRVTCLLNVALCSMPATYGIAPLVRAQLHDRRRAVIVRGMLTPEIIQAAMTAITEKNGDAALEILNDLVVAAASGGEAAPAEAEEPEASAVDEAPAEEPETPPEEAAVRAVETRVAKLESDAIAAEAAERNTLVARLVAAGAETPATAWTEKGKTPVARLVGEPIAELRSRVAALEAVRKPAIKAPVSADPIKALSANDLAACKRAGITPEEFVARKASALRRAPGAK